jgi:hypothetical protein
MGFAMGFENFGNRHSGRELDLGVSIDESHPKTRRETPPDGGLSGSHHADKRQRPPGERRDNGGLG